MRGLTTALVSVLLIAPVAASDVVISKNAQAGPVSANTINPYDLLDSSKEELAQCFPSLSRAELDRLLFKIADINSIRSLEHHE